MSADNIPDLIHEEYQLAFEWGTVEAANKDLDIPNDIDDKQWFLELESIKLREKQIVMLEKRAEAAKAKALAELQKAENEKYQLKNMNSGSEFDCVIEVDCAYCGSKFSYRGNDPDIADTSVARFFDVHDPCGRSRL